ncbi:hypothetical protein NM208_g15372 [Fusarium decemcellulare]|uniref:Uncharacterized protein n=1 Tax=Fusarium decemcellulare TaxID=57161 RepID=A0ACC1RDB5_9HYPO|nr:hypothetical protein NM208_g15372 [Fusarium decemcellulare]
MATEEGVDDGLRDTPDNATRKRETANRPPTWLRERSQRATLRPDALEDLEKGSNCLILLIPNDSGDPARLAWAEERFTDAKLRCGIMRIILISREWLTEAGPPAYCTPWDCLQVYKQRSSEQVYDHRVEFPFIISDNELTSVYNSMRKYRAVAMELTLTTTREKRSADSMAQVEAFDARKLLLRALSVTS